MHKKEGVFAHSEAGSVCDRTQTHAVQAGQGCVSYLGTFG